jgi:paraquat-inducible protein B
MRANPTLIGSFVVGAVVLGVGALLLFGSSEYFKQKDDFILFFREPVNGLSAGSPVKMSGVKIGQVMDVKLVYDEAAEKFRTPVTIEVFPTAFGRMNAREQPDQDTEEILRELIDRGLRATLVTESLITGQLGISMGFHPESKAELVGGDLPFPEIPTTTTGLTKLLKEVEQIPIREIFADLHETITAVKDRVDSKEVTRLIESATTTVEEYGKLGRRIGDRAGPLIDSLTKTSDAAGEAVTEAGRTLARMEERLDGIGTQLDATLKSIENLGTTVRAELPPTAEEVRKTLASARSVIADLEGLTSQLADDVGRDSETMTSLRALLVELTGAARAIKGLATMLERQPEALLRGKRGD